MDLTALLTVGALAFATNILTSLVKRWVYPTYGAFGLQVIAFALALIGAFVFLYGNQFPGLMDLLVAGGIIFSTAVAFYEVVLQRIDVFKGTDPVVVAARKQGITKIA